MKKLLILSVCLISMQIAYCESSFGIRAGINLANIAEKNSLGAGGSKSAPGWDAAILGVIGIGQYFDFQPEFHFVQKGQASRYNGYRSHLAINYVELPILLKPKFSLEKINFYIAVGPFVGYALSKVQHTKIGGEKNKNKVEFDNSFDPDGRKEQRIDAGFVTAGGIEFGSKTKFVVDIRFTPDFVNGYKYEFKGPNIVKAYNRSFAITTGVLF